MFDSGAAVAAALSAAGADLDEAQRQPNGVDLTSDAVFAQTEPGQTDRAGMRAGNRRDLE